MVIIIIFYLFRRKKVDYSWTVKYITEFLGTAILLILGNGAVANVDLKGTKGFASGWMTIAWGYGCGVMIPALMFGNVSGNHINPAFTLGLAISGLFPWAHVLPYIIAQLLGAMAGQLVVVAIYRPYYLKTDNKNHILGTFATIDNAGTRLNGFLNEFFGSFVLFFGAVAITKNFFGAQASSEALAGINGITEHGLAAIHGGALEVGHLALGFLVMTLVASVGGPTGPALNPARDFGPRLLHQFLPKSILGEHKGDSQWWYAWVPILAPILGATAGVALFKLIYL
ncbi:aquaporin family protein [Enterococcus sp. MMGLQ5-2]|nr:MULTISPECIES: aquaglyceroporin Gla [unclassified Enterococcus]MBS7577434.1 aquaporin family protein [Enterococcus sp. MMGLQ5-2]MBS7584841.1 aquaporin family protein [Enterococcus sp. MMGLQ5-1]